MVFCIILFLVKVSQLPKKLNFSNPLRIKFTKQYLLFLSAARTVRTLRFRVIWSIFFSMYRYHVQWHPAITKCHGTEENVHYSGIFVIVKTPLWRIIWLTTKIFVITGQSSWTMGYTSRKTVYRLPRKQLRLNKAKLWRSKFSYLDQ